MWLYYSVLMREKILDKFIIIYIYIYIWFIKKTLLGNLHWDICDTFSSTRILCYVNCRDKYNKRINTNTFVLLKSKNHNYITSSVQDTLGRNTSGYRDNSLQYCKYIFIYKCRYISFEIIVYIYIYIYIAHFSRYIKYNKIFNQIMLQ